MLFRQVQDALEKYSEIYQSIQWMEETGGEPDVVSSLAEDESTIVIADCSKEAPAGRRSVCYDETARLGRKKNAPADSAMELAQRHGVILLDEKDYRLLQQTGDFDQKTSCWLLTPERIRSKGGTLFGEKRYSELFIYHNGADSYYQVRGFRTKLILPV